LRHQLHGDSRDNCSPDAAATVKKKHMSDRYLPIVRPQARMTKSEIENIARALKAKVKAAQTAILALAPKLLTEFEVQLNVEYPASGDSVWMDALNEVYRVYEIQRVRVEARSKELRIPERFRPHLTEPGWVSSWKSSAPDFKDYRAEMRRLASIQIDDMIKGRLALLERDSADIQYELAVQGCVTEAAQQFLAKLPAIESLIPKLKVSEVEAMIEGRATGIPPAMLNAGSAESPALTAPEKPQLPSSDA
jgi:hypothetical protein